MPIPGLQRSRSSPRSAALNSRVEQLKPRLAQILKQTSHEDEAPRLRHEAEEDRLLLKDVQEASNAVQAGAILLRCFCGDEKATRISGIAYSVVQGYSLIVQYSADLIGDFTLAGGLLGLASNIKRLLSGNHDSNLTDQLGVLSSKLDISKDIALDIEHRQDAITRSIQNLYAYFMDTREALTSKLARIRKDLLSNNINDEADKRAVFEVAFRRDISACLQKIVETPRDQRWTNDLGELCDRIKEYGTIAAKQRIFAHSDGDDIPRELIAARRSDLFFGWIPKALSVVNFPFALKIKAINEDNVLPNPIAWAQACRACLAVQGLSDEKLPGVIERLQELWTEGMRLREATLALTSETFFTSLGHSYSDSAGQCETKRIKRDGAMPRIRIAQWDEQEIEANGVFGICRDLLIQFYRERNLPLFFSVNESLKRIPDMENGDFWAFDGIMAQAFTVTHVEPDPLQYCLQQEWLSLSRDTKGP